MYIRNFTSVFFFNLFLNCKPTGTCDPCNGFLTNLPLRRTWDTEDDAYMSLVKAYIEAGTCDEVSTGSLCGEEATSYYKEFEYLGQKVIITNSIPDHEAESDAVKPNPNTR